MTTQCACGTFAIGQCGDCGKPVCGDHSVLGTPRRCLDCHAALVASELATADAEHDAGVAGLAAIADPSERLVRAAKRFTRRTGGALGAVPSVVLSPQNRADFVRVCPEVDVDALGVLNSVAPWDSLAVGRWFAARAAATGVRPNGTVALVEQHRVFGVNRSRTNKPRECWFIRGGSTYRRQSSSQPLDIWILTDGAVMSTYNDGVTHRPGALSLYGVVAMADLLGI